jgi:NTP pyrophosphatase (non-canonical NTP hydrolase)
MASLKDLAERDKIYAEINAERAHQDYKHPKFPKHLRMEILVEEVGEVAKGLQEKEADNLRYELIQVASVAIRWLEHLKKEG